MDALTAEETEAFYNDIALPPVPLGGTYDTCARAASHSYPAQIDLLLQNASSEASVAQQVQQQNTITGSGRGITPSETHSSIPPDRCRNPPYTSSGSPAPMCSTSPPNSSSGASTALPAASISAPVQDHQQQHQGNSPLSEGRFSSSAASRLQPTAAAVVPGAAGGEPTGVSLPAATGLAASRRDTEDLSGTVNLFDQEGTQNTGVGTRCLVPPTPKATPAALPRGVMDGNSSSSSVGGRAACSYSNSGDAAAGGREVLPLAVSQVQAVYLAVRRKVFGRAAPWKEFCQFSSFERPATGAVAVDRVERNVRFFFMNYALLCATLVALAVIVNPAILVVGAVFGGAAAAAGLQGGSSIRIGESTVVPVKNVRYFCGAAGLFTLLFVAGQLIVGLLAGCAVLILLHAALHIGVSYEKIAQHCADDFDCAV